MPKKVLLVDNELKMIGHIIEHTDWIIEVLITTKKRPGMKNERIRKVYIQNDFRQNNDLQNFVYEDFYSFWHAQLKVENCFNRELVDYQLGKWSYYRGFALVKKIFDENEIDFVIVKGLNHGWVYDRLITDMATNKGIDNYNVGDALEYTRSVYNNLSNKLVPVSESTIAIENSLFYQLPQEIKSHPQKGLKGYIYRLSYKLFGTLGIEFVDDIFRRSFSKDILTTTIFEKIYEYRSFIRASRYYDSIAVDLDVHKNFICYAMQLEPEAAVAGMAEMDSQIAVIQMLASCLPTGWKLYVKEHPHQFSVNRSAMFKRDIYATGVFKSKRFYQEISKIKQVFFLKRETDMKKVIASCRAMATMTGSVAAEAVVYKKPVFVFAAERTVYKLARGFFNIASYDDCKRAMKKIFQNGDVEYTDFEEVCAKYLIDFTDETEGLRIAIKTIKEDIG